MTRSFFYALMLLGSYWLLQLAFTVATIEAPASAIAMTKPHVTMVSSEHGCDWWPVTCR